MEVLLGLFLYFGNIMPKLKVIINYLYFYSLFLGEQIFIGSSLEALQKDPLCGQKRLKEEWAIPIQQSELAVRKLRDFIAVDRANVKVSFPVEFTFCQGDDVPMSPAFGRATAFVSVSSFFPIHKSHQEFLNGFREIMKKLDGRPSWLIDNGSGHSEIDLSLGGDIVRNSYKHSWVSFQNMSNKLEFRH